MKFWDSMANIRQVPKSPRNHLGILKCENGTFLGPKHPNGCIIVKAVMCSLDYS